MIETPPSFAATPEAAQAGQDVLAEMLRSVRLTGSVFLNGCFTAPFGIRSPKQFDEATPMAHLRHISIFHLVSAGECSVELATGEQRRVSAGDILLMPFADEHTFSNGRPDQVALADELVRPGPVKGMWNINCGGGGEETRIVCGFIESSEFLLAPVFRTLPPLLVERTEDDRVSAVITSTVRQILELTEAAAPGTEFMLGRLMELLFVEILRRYVTRLPASAKGWFAALNDPVVSRVLQLVHADPARHCTTPAGGGQSSSGRHVGPPARLEVGSLTEEDSQERSAHQTAGRRHRGRSGVSPSCGL